MRLNGIAGPEQLAVLTGVLDDFCRSNAIASNSEERDNVGRLLVSLAERGWQKADDLKAMLTASRRSQPTGTTSTFCSASCPPVVFSTPTIGATSE
ncbi:hypothetical protein [Mesorhizobium sp. CN2-181]|uniref:hypothetical protein n=1 Tax=Mesorhizobium yinganensis TaxID=3157707 RepID=UPI0032B76D0D